MAGQPGRSGGSNRTHSTSVKMAGANAPTQRGLAKPDFYIYREEMTREEIYEAIASKLHDLGLTDKDDGPIVSMLASQYEMLQDAQRIYDQEGPCALIGRALASRIITEAQKEIRILLSEFYLTPSTRGKRPEPDSGSDSIVELMQFRH